MDTVNESRAAARVREARYRARRRAGAKWVPVGVTPEQRAGLEKLGLLEPEADRYAVAAAVARLLNAAEHLAAVGVALFPEGDG